jgi:CRP/FNR family transcriptional regulator, cyclic AMP receptor protein
MLAPHGGRGKRRAKRLEYAGAFMRAARAAATATASADALVLPHWVERDWEAVLARTTLRPVAAHEIVISRGAEERSLYFTLAGEYEVGGAYIGGVSLTSLARIPPGSVFGEQSFFDALPRSANVWAHATGELLVLPFAGYEALSAAAPALARDLAFALARILSLRLRNTTVRVH